MDSSTNKQYQGSTLTLKVIHAGPDSFNVNITLVMGEKDAVLIDVPFQCSEGHRVVAEILESKRNLKYIYITHSHPDHYFSAPVFIQAFPDAELIAVPKVCMNIGMSIPGRLRHWSPLLGMNGPRYPLIPKPYYDSFIELEGEKLEILGPLTGDHNESTAIYIPSLKAIIASDIVYSGIHMFMAHSTPDDRKKWLETIDYLTSLKPEIVVAGHKQAGMSDGPDSLQYCRDYLIFIEQAISQTGSSAELMAAVRKRFPDVQDVMDDFILTRSAMVASGEAEPALEMEGI
jgi:glyoxylase-like metal-dependent hydrolase (beta-lactamase superfamily II)